jgi:hypothetical protein
MRLSAQLLELVLHRGALATDVFEAALVVAELLIEGLGALREKREGGRGKSGRRE